MFKLNQTKHLILAFGLFSSMMTYAQDTYQTPPKPLADLVNAQPTPSVSVNAKGTLMLIIERSDLPSIADLAQPELKLAGLRLNPLTNGGSRQSYALNFKIKKLSDNSETQVTGLPDNPKLSAPSWSPDESKVAFTHTKDNTIELYVLDIATAKAAKLTDLAINATLGSPLSWLPDSKGF